MNEKKFLSFDEIDQLITMINESYPEEQPKKDTINQQERANRRMELYQKLAKLNLSKSLFDISDVCKILELLFSSMTNAMSSNLSILTGKSAIFSESVFCLSNREKLLSMLPNNVTVIKANYIYGFIGEHVYLFSEKAALTIASLVIREEEIEFDEMAKSLISEVISQMIGNQINVLTDMTGNKLAAASPITENFDKKNIVFPEGEFILLTYNLDLNGKNYEMWEILGESLAKNIFNSLIDAVKTIL